MFCPRYDSIFFRALSLFREDLFGGWQRQLETEPEPGEMLNPLLGGAERLCLESPLSSGEAALMLSLRRLRLISF